MGYVLNLIIFTIAFAFLIGNILVLNNNVCTATIDASSTAATISTSLTAFFGTAQGLAIIGAGGGSILLGTLFFPNPWLIFLGPTIVLYGYVNYLQNILNQCNLGISGTFPVEVQALFSLLVVMMFGLAILSWFKGGGDL